MSGSGFKPVRSSGSSATVTAQLVDAIPVSSRTPGRVDAGSGIDAERIGLLLSLFLLGVACVPRGVLVRAGASGRLLGSWRPGIAIVGLAIAFGALVNVLLGGASR